MPTRNVLNIDEVDSFLEDLAQHISRPELQSWLRSTVRRWILKHYDRYDRVVRDPASGRFALIDPESADGTEPQPITGDLPFWCGAALKRGDEVILLRLGPSLRKRVLRSVAALQASLDEGKPVSLERIGFPDAEAMAAERRRTDFTRRRAERQKTGVIPVYRSARNAVVTRLASPESLQLEGTRMVNCVASYWDDVAAGDCEIYSLRDHEGKSRATIEVDSDGRVWQLKGPLNGPIDARFRPALQCFIRDRGNAVLDDGENLVLDRKMFRTDPARLEQFLVARGGLARLRDVRFAGPEVLAREDVAVLLWTIAANASRLSDEVRRALFTALAPSDRRLVRIRRVRAYWIYDRLLPLYRIELPLLLLNLVRLGVFRKHEVEAFAAAHYRAAEVLLAPLALSAPDRLFALGPGRADERWRKDLLESPADVLLRSAIDVSALRAARHQALRRAMNQAKRRFGGRRARVGAGHLAVRRLLDGERGEYVI